MRKNLSKPNKVRQILKLDEIKSNVSQARIDKVLQELEELEKRQKKRKNMSDMQTAHDEARATCHACEETYNLHAHGLDMTW